MHTQFQAFKYGNLVKLFFLAETKYNYICYLKAQLGKEFYSVYFAMDHKLFDVMDYTFKHIFSLDL